MFLGLIPGSLNVEDVWKYLASRSSSDGLFEFTAAVYGALQFAGRTLS